MESEDIIALQSAPIDIGSAIGAAGDGGSGAIAMFLGTTRREKRSDGQELIALDYEAYGEMAIGQMRKLADQARGRWAIRKITMIHRIGRVEVGQPSVMIVVSTAHRTEAFDACRFLIDGLKAEAAIWKKEIWGDESSNWV